MVGDKTRNKVTLYACPHACSFVSHLALQISGAEFKVKWINLFQQEQSTPEYLALSPRGKVPLLLSADCCVSENIAILTWLTQKFPQARLLPDPQSADFVGAISTLSWFSSGIHPFLSRVIAPNRFAKTEAGADEVRESAMESLAMEFARIDARMENREWWGEALSALDFYPLWLWARSGESTFDQSPYPHYMRYVRRLLTVRDVMYVLEHERSYMECYAGLDS